MKIVIDAYGGDNSPSEIIKGALAALKEKEEITRVKEALANDACKRCGCALVHTPGRKKKQFCSDACRLRWWHEHRYMSKTAKSTKCAACGRAFMTDRGQRYCSHACYIRMRFGESRGNGTQQAQ